MKKHEFLNAIKGLRITVKFSAVTPCENGKPVFEGLPESLEAIHPNQVLAWLKAWIPCIERKNERLSAWEAEYSRRSEKFDDCGYIDSYVGEAGDWVAWCEQHPDLVFNC